MKLLIKAACLKFILFYVNIFTFSVSILLLRKQAFINDTQWLKRMISHHSTALTTSHKIYNKTYNYRQIKNLNDFRQVSHKLHRDLHKVRR